MSTLEAALELQKRNSILQAPSENVNNNNENNRGAVQEQLVMSTSPTLNIALQNNTSSPNVWAYVTGLDINKNNAVLILQSDGVTGYYPQSPNTPLSALAQDCHIRLGGPGTTRTVTVPQMAGGRIWFARDGQLTFLLNPGPALVEPSATNTSDPNYSVFWSFAEFTFNTTQLFANITFVDFVSLPVSLALASATPGAAAQSVPGLPAAGLDAVSAGLVAQNASDGAGWDRLVVKTAAGANLRALSPNAGIVMDATLLRGYYQPYVDAVWAKYAAAPLNVDTQGQWGVVQGKVSSSSGSAQLSFGNGVGAFAQPSSADVFSCSTGPFANPTGSAELGNIGARLAAAFNRSTLLVNANQPAAERVATYYVSNQITNHYARIVHAAVPGGKGYAFPYDDVAPDDADNVAGTVADGNPQLLTWKRPSAWQTESPLV
ncbi:glycoside hydrolase family 64 protein [Lasiosphaeria ovina]|uniref:Glycoside hydrolase family 64 protein n=1 Tax=Lasiosphaeria ovina TaxID=92902 RepID=A0AAE0KNU0_9PEZI|nr:glycoside hydrolase family 64 protein [Lasiosphaeria ovina]